MEGLIKIHSLILNPAIAVRFAVPTPREMRCSRRYVVRHWPSVPVIGVETPVD